jgi:hypothetical protein
MMNADQIEKLALEHSAHEFDRLIAAGWRRRDAARNARMAYDQMKARLASAACAEDRDA